MRASYWWSLTDNYEFHQKAISEYTANLCANSLGQEVFGVMADESPKKYLMAVRPEKLLHEHSIKVKKRISEAYSWNYCNSS